MNRLKRTPLDQWRARVIKHEQGSAIIELAIVFPILLLLFVGAAELGRLFYTYTTLSKATYVGARYLSTSRDVVNGINAQAKTDAKNRAKNLVVCGINSISTTACNGQTPVVPGLTTANVLICDNFSTACSPALAGGSTKYFRVEIQNYTYLAGVWNVETQTGTPASTFYFLLRPGTQARSMQQ